MSTDLVEKSPLQHRTNESARGWSIVRLGDVGDIASGITLGRPLRNRSTRRVPYLRVANVRDGWLDLSDVREIDATEEEIEKCRLAYGDLLLTEGGDPDKLGRGTFWQGQIPECIHQNHIFRVRLPDNGFCPEFVSFQIGSHYGKSYFLAHAKQTTGIATINRTVLNRFPLKVTSVDEQRRIAAHLREQLTEVATSQAATRTQSESLGLLTHALLRESLSNGRTQTLKIDECLREVTEGIGLEWSQYPVLGATRSGIAPAKDPVGKNPGRYKPVRPRTIFYNPMRILLGSIAMADEDDPSGITSPDYVVMTAIDGKLNARWFYHWFRSRYGEDFIRSLTRGAVRERLLFRRLGSAAIQLPDWETQQQVANLLLEARRAKERLQQKLRVLDQLPAALLRQAFSGKV